MFSKQRKKDVRLLILGCILVLVYSFGYEPVVVIGNSMNPSNKNLDLILIDKLSYEFELPKRGDVILCYDYKDNDFMIKRVLGLPRDTIQIIEGWIFVNGDLYIDEFSHINVTDGISMHPWNLEEKEYWVIGDNRDETWCGIVHENSIIGKIKE